MAVASADEGRRDPERRRTRAPDGRIASAFTAMPAPEVRALEAALKGAIEGEVRFDAGSRALYATDSSNYRQVPVGVVVPKSLADVERTVALCRAHDAPLLPRGGGTSLAGETCNTAVIIDFSKYLHRVLAVDPERRLARVEPGCVLDALRDAAEVHDLTFGPDPATHDHNTLGGMIGNNSGGVHAIMAGITVHNVEALEVLTYDGLRLRVGPMSDAEFQAILAEGGRRAEIYRDLDRFRRAYEPQIRARYPQIPRRVSGYENLDQLFPENGFNVARALVGTEGTCVTVLEAELNLIPSPREHAIAILGFSDVFAAADAVPRVLEHGPMGLEGMDERLVDLVRKNPSYAQSASLLPEGAGWLIVQFGGDTHAEATDKAKALCRDFTKRGDVHGRVLSKEEKEAKIWSVRDAALGVTAWTPDGRDTWPGWEDSAVHRDNLGGYLRDLVALFDKYGYEPAVYGHFGDGLVHCSVAFDLKSEKGIDAWRAFLDEAADLVVRYNGSLSGEHGDGEARGALLEKMYGPELVEGFRQFKAIWDPLGKMNPGKVVDPYPITANLRRGPEFHPTQPQTHFSFREDGGFLRAAERCVGVGECRRRTSDAGVMCPSYMATGEEKHSTRGRSRLLFEMLEGNPIAGGWKSDEVEDALSLCLACKGCKSDCPVNVDMASLKAEFRSHYYRGRLRPRSQYSMGLIYWWARAASKAPALANFVTRAPGIGRLAKAVGGIAPERTVPPFARQTFRDWFRRRARPAGRGERVLLWPDTFNNFFRPETAIAATEVLETAGYEVVIPARPLCCGRPLYDSGMLGAAKRLWRQTFATLDEEIARGTPVIGLEPACVSAFKDELPDLFPEEPAAQRLSGQAVFFSDFLTAHADRLPVGKTGGKALVQLHCHHHAVIKDAGEKKLMDALGLDYEIVPSGCCGMAGAFGFAKESYEVGIAAGERVLLPRVRAAEADTLVLADGFSCREQIEQGTGRPAIHIAELAAAALRDGEGRP